MHMSQGRGRRGGGRGKESTADSMLSAEPDAGLGLKHEITTEPKPRLVA